MEHLQNSKGKTMTEKKIKVGSKVKHKKHGIGRVEVIHEQTEQCNVDFIKAGYHVCQLSDLKRLSTAGTCRFSSTVNKLKEY